MSKASDWATKLREATTSRPEPYVAPNTDADNRKCYARVTDAGQCGIHMKGAEYGSAIDPDIAVDLARWILDTFSEPEATAP